MSIEQTTITIKYKDAPGEGKKNWKIKGDSKTAYSLSPELAAQVNVGDTVTVDYEPKMFNGFPVNMVKTLSHGSAEAPAAPVQPHWEPPSRPNVSRPLQAAPAPRNGNGHSTDKQIFVTGVVGRAMGSGNFDASHIATLTQFACEAWEAFFRG